MPMAAFPNLIPALPEIFLATITVVLLLYGVFQRDVPAEGVRTSGTVSYMGVTTLVLTIFIVTALTHGRALTFNGMFVTDSFAVYTKVLVLLGAALALFMAQDYLRRQAIARFEFAILVLLATLGMMMMISANDLISLYVGLELQSLSLYVIAAFQRDDNRSTEAGLKYFVLGAVASGMLLYGASMIYGFAGTTNFDTLANQLSATHGMPSIGIITGIVFILAGLAFKVSAVPFHMWTPDVYEGAPTPVTAFFSVAPKIAALALLMRVMVGPFGELVDQWRQVVIVMSIASMLLGSLAAINQRDIKRLMAYSSIGHVGYALIGLAVGNAVGIRGVLVYLTIYLFMNLGAFACILTMRRSDLMVEKIDDLAGLSKTHPMVAFAMAVFMFSMAGIPPTAGFFGKLYIFLPAIQEGLYTLAIIGVLASVVSAFYYLRIIKVMYFDEAVEPLDRPVNRNLSIVLAASGVIILLFFAVLGPVLSSAGTAAAALFGG